MNNRENDEETLKAKENLEQIALEIKKLTQDIHKYNHYYHTKDTSLISDEEFDALFRRLLTLEEKYPKLKESNSPTTKVGGVIAQAFTQAQHIIPMLSLNNIFSNMEEVNESIRHAELLQFNKRIYEETKSPEVEYVASPKYDGVAISLIYKNGKFFQGITRGDGFVGEDVTLNLKGVKTVPKLLKVSQPPELLEVRGEVLILTNDFLKLNEQQAKLNLKTFANPRNAAAGSIRQLDPTISMSRPLHFFAYSIARLESQINLSFNTFLEELDYLKECGFDISNYTQICKTTQDLINYYESTFENRANLPFGIDGVVFKVNNKNLQEKLGYVIRAPRFAIAYKFPAELVESQILSINVQVGRTGALTPVAKIKPVLVGGVIVSNATLHNADEVKRKDVRTGDYVIVRRAGDVIPEIVKVVTDKRTGYEVEFMMPITCPVCNSHIARLEGETIIRCTAGLYCTAQLKQSLTHFASRNALDIEGLSEKTISLLVDQKLVKHTPDLFTLKEEQLLTLPGFKHKKATNLINAIAKSKTPQLNKLIYALGIRHVGEATAKDLANRFITLENLMQATLEELLSIHDIGEIVAKSIIDFFSEKHNIEVIEKLDLLGVKYISPARKIDETSNNPILGKTFVLTGTLEHYTREQAKELIEEHGGKVVSSVSKNTDYVLAGSDPGSKLQKAQELSVKILDEDEFVKLFLK